MKSLEILALLESRLEDTIGVAVSLAPEVVSSREHACEKERRQVRSCQRVPLDL